MSITQVMGRLGALLLAAALVVGALVIRDSRADGGNGGEVDPGPDVATATPEPGVVRCAAELGICDALQEASPDLRVVTADGVATARELQSADTVSTWVTLESLVAVTEDGRARNSRGVLFAPDAPAVATSPLVLVGWDDRLEVLAGGCGVTWSCIGEVAGGSWSDVGGDPAWGPPKPAWDAPDRSGLGLLVLAQALADRLDGATLSSRNLDVGEVQGWLSDLTRAVPSFSPSSSSQLVEMVQFGRASRDVVGTTEAEAASVLDRAGSRAAGLVVSTSSPPVEARVVVARPAGGGGSPDGLEALVEDLLVVAGWRTTSGLPPGPELPTPLPAADGEAPALTGGSLEAVLTRWERVR